MNPSNNSNVPRWPSPKRTSVHMNRCKSIRTSALRLLLCSLLLPWNFTKMNLPIDRNAELGVIGACMDGAVLGGIETALEAGEILPTRCFYHSDCQFVYERILDAVKVGRVPDMFAISTQWKGAFSDIPFPVEFFSAQDSHPKWALHHRVESVRDLYKRRQAMIAGHTLTASAEQMDRPLIDSIAEFEDILGQSQTNTPPVLGGKQLAHQLNDDLERRFELNGALSGIDTGFSGLNAITDGLQAGELWVIGARPSVGKTGLMLNIANHVALTQGIPCLIVSLEMSAVALTRRLLACRGSVNGTSIRRGTFTPDEFKALAGFYAKLKDAPLYILDSPGGIKITQLCHAVRAAIKRWGVRVVFIDYLQKIRPESKGEKRTYEIGDTSSQLVDLTKREKINLFALAQLNRENEKEKGRPPRLSDLADSKSIEADADFVGLLDRPINGDETRATLRVAKQRDGERGTIHLQFQGWHCRFLMAPPENAST